jgi:transcriptional regulator with XRE-family HTH domain
MKQVNLNFIKDRRIDLKLSLEHVANSLGFKNASTYLKYENGDYAFKADHMPLLAEILKCEIMDFFTQNVSKIAT